MIVKFFVTPIYPYGNDHYYHEIIALAEGFTNLGYKVIGNVNYWFQPENQEYLIKEDNWTGFDLAIYDYRYVRSFAHLLFRKNYPNFDFSKKHVLVDRNDWINPIWEQKEHYKIFDLIVAGNLYNNIKYPDNVKPWAIGLTNRIINQIDKTYNPNTDLTMAIGTNFRVPHNLRMKLHNGLKENIKNIRIQDYFTEAPEKNENSLDYLYWLSSTGRHNPKYYTYLNSVLLFSSYGGYYEYKPVLYQPYNFIKKIKRKPYYFYSKLLAALKKDISPACFIFQYDNFRFWEVLYSRSCPINVNYESWSLKLSVNPEEGVHYLGINNFNFKEFSSRLEKLSIDEIKSIGEAGREWVFEHYSPLAQAKRVLNFLNE